MVIGDRRSVSMDTVNAYAGSHAVHISMPGHGGRAGIVQERLALVEGREYTGRIVLRADDSVAPLEVSLVWGGGASDRETVAIDEAAVAYTTVPLTFTAGKSTDNGRLEIVGRGSGNLSIGAVSLMPADNVSGWRADTIALLEELNAPVYRWPGGNFVSGYDWEDGIGDPDRRPPRKNPAWKGIEHNDVGINEYMTLMRLIEAEPFIAVNTGLGGAEAAAREVEYANGSTETPMGKLRAEHGHPEPYGVAWWAVGNEMYGEWQLGHMPLAEYVTKHNRVVDAMRAVDSSIRPIAVGAVGEWSRQMLASSAHHMDLISEHIYWQDEEDLVEHVQQISARIKSVADAHRSYRNEIGALEGKDIRIAMDEWNYWYGPYEYGELGVRYYLQDALGIAAGLHEFFRNSDMYFMANYAQTVNVIGAIKTTETQADLETTGLVLKLYRHHFGTTPVSVSGDFEPLDIAAALTEDGRALTVAVVNPTAEHRTIGLDIEGSTLTGSGRRWLLTGADRWAHNAPGMKRQVDVGETSFTEFPTAMDVEPLSVTVFELAIR
jgi:alpha-N-arabinofuranosidase